jgi:hypothetical protein
VHEPKTPWYAVELAHGPDDETAALRREFALRSDLSAPAHPAPKQGGMSTQATWIITLLVIIALFEFCVLLAFTTEIRITPSAG